MARAKSGMPDFLKSLDFQKYIPFWNEHGIDLRTLMNMTNDQLQELESDMEMNEEDIIKFLHSLAELRKEALSDFLKSFGFEKYTLKLLEYDITLRRLVTMDDANLDKLGVEILMSQDDIDTFKYRVQMERKETAQLSRKKWLLKLEAYIEKPQEDLIQRARRTLNGYFNSNKNCHLSYISRRSDLYNVLVRDDDLFLGIVLYELKYPGDILPSTPQQSVSQCVSRLFDEQYIDWEQRFQNIYDMNMNFWVEWKTKDGFLYYVNTDTHESLWDSEIALEKKKKGSLIITNAIPKEYTKKRKRHWHSFGWKWKCCNCEKVNAPSLKTQCLHCNYSRNVFDVISERIRTIPRNATFVIRALRVFRHESQKRAAPLSENVVAAVLLAMEENPDNVLINTTAFMVLRNFSWGTAQHKEIMRKTNAIEVIVSAMLNHQSEANLQEKACEAIRNITIDDDNEKRAIQVGAIQRVIDAMKLHIYSSSVQKKAIQALFNLTSIEIHKKVAIEADAIRSLDDVMKQYSDLPMLISLATTVKEHIFSKNSCWSFCSQGPS